MVIDMGYWTKVIKRLFIFIFTIIGVFLSFKLAIFYIPFLIAFIISLLVEPSIKWLTKKNLFSRKISATLVLIFVSILIITILTLGIINIISESSNLLKGLNGYIEKVYLKSQNLINNIDFKLPEVFLDVINTSSQNFLQMASNWLQATLSSFLKYITSLPSIFICIGITLLSTYFICTDKIYILDQMEHHIPKSWIKRFLTYLRKIINSLGSYLKAEFILVFISFIITLVGLYIMHIIGMNVEFPLLVALAIGFVDALPILGSGTIIIPWAVLSAIDGDISLSISLLTLLAIISIVRQIVEPKIVSSQIGIHPIFTLIAMYTGFKIIGIVGLLAGPIILIVLKNVFETLIDRGVIKSIFDKK